MSELQIEYIPLHYTEGLTQEQVKAFRIMDNKSHNRKMGKFHK